MNLKLIPYLIARGLSVIYRPFILFLISTISIPSSNIIGLVFVNTTLSMLFIQAESHRAFYKIHFIEESTYQFNGRHYFQYLGLLALMLTLGTIIAFLLGVFKFSAAPFAIACILYFLIEKIFDEVLRYDLFAKKFNRWAKLSFLRFSIFILSIAPVLLWKNSNVLILCFGINFFGCFIALQLINKDLKKVVDLFFRNYLRLIKIGLKSVNMVVIFWVLSISASLFNNYDRIFIYFFKKSEIAYLLIVFMLFSVIQLIVEFFFTSISRSDILKGKFDNMKFVFTPKFISILLGGVAISFIAYYIFHRFNKIYTVNADYRIASLVALSQISLAIIAILREINFWKFSQKRLLKIEFLNIISLTGIFSAFYFLSGTYSLYSFLIIFNFVFLARITTYAVSIKLPEYSLIRRN